MQKAARNATESDDESEQFELMKKHTEQRIELMQEVSTTTRHLPAS